MLTKCKPTGIWEPVADSDLYMLVPQSFIGPYLLTSPACSTAQDFPANVHLKKTKIPPVCSTFIISIQKQHNRTVEKKDTVISLSYFKYT